MPVHVGTDQRVSTGATAVTVAQRGRARHGRSAHEVRRRRPRDRGPEEHPRLRRERGARARQPRCASTGSTRPTSSAARSSPSRNYIIVVSRGGIDVGTGDDAGAAQINVSGSLVPATEVAAPHDAGEPHPLRGRKLPRGSARRASGSWPAGVEIARHPRRCAGGQGTDPVAQGRGGLAWQEDPRPPPTRRWARRGRRAGQAG